MKEQPIKSSLAVAIASCFVMSCGHSFKFDGEVLPPKRESQDPDQKMFDFMEEIDEDLRTASK